MLNRAKQTSKLSGLVFSVLLSCHAYAETAVTLNENCVINILNRTVQVQPNGSWGMPNVPSTMGQVRARATCVVKGETISGQSDYFSVVNNGSVDVPPIQFGSQDPVPQKIEFSPTLPASITGIGNNVTMVMTAFTCCCWMGCMSMAPMG